MKDPINIYLCVFGIFMWPGLTFCIILWLLGHPILGILALFSIESTTKIRKIVKKQIVDSRTGQVVVETESEEQ